MPADRDGPLALVATVRTNAEVGWCLRELAKRDTNHARKDILAPIQNAAIHYACISAKKQGGSVTTAVKDKRTVEIYKSFAAKGMMEWIVEEADRPLPSWLTVQLMGHSTVTGADEPKLYKSGNTLWGRYRKSAASIRKDFNVIWDEFMLNGKFPPGAGVKQVMENLQQKLYILEQKRKPVKGALETVVEDDGNAAEGAERAGGEGTVAGTVAGTIAGTGVEGTDGTTVSASEVAAAAAAVAVAVTAAVAGADSGEAGGKGKGPANPDEAVTNGKEGAEGLGAGPGEGGAPKEGSLVNVTEGPPARVNDGPIVKMEGSVAKVNGGSAAGGTGAVRPPEGGPHPELEEDDVKIYGRRPDGWLHPASLVFAMYGRPSAREDGDLKMQEGGDGPSGRKRKSRDSGGRDGSSVVDVSSSDVEGDGGSVNPRSLEPRSRAKARKENERRQVASESLAMQKEVLQHIMSPAGSKHEAALVASLQAITEVFVGRQALDLEAAGREREAAARARWQQKTDALQAHLKLLQQLGRGQGEEADRVANTLFSHLDTVTAMATPPTHT